MMVMVVARANSGPAAVFRQFGNYGFGRHQKGPAIEGRRLAGAVRTTLAGSMMPLSIRSPYSADCAS